MSCHRYLLGWFINITAQFIKTLSIQSFVQLRYIESRDFKQSVITDETVIETVVNLTSMKGGKLIGKRNMKGFSEASF